MRLVYVLTSILMLGFLWMTSTGFSCQSNGKTYEWLGMGQVLKQSQSSASFQQRYGWGLDGECYFSHSRNQYLNRHYDHQTGDRITTENRTRNTTESCNRTTRQYRY